MVARIFGFLVSSLIQLVALAVLVIASLARADKLPWPPAPHSTPVWIAPSPPRSVPVSTRRRSAGSSERAPRPAYRFFAPATVPARIVPELELSFDFPGDARDSPPAVIPGGLETEPPTVKQTPSSPARVGGDVRPPRKLRHVPPVYPPAARQARIEGEVLLEALIDTEGNVTNLVVVHSVPLLDPAAMEAVRQWRYEPTRLNGVAVPIVLSVTVSFRLARNGALFEQEPGKDSRRRGWLPLGNSMNGPMWKQ